MLAPQSDSTWEYIFQEREANHRLADRLTEANTDSDSGTVGSWNVENMESSTKTGKRWTEGKAEKKRQSKGPGAGVAMGCSQWAEARASGNGVTKGSLIWWRAQSGWLSAYCEGIVFCLEGRGSHSSTGIRKTQTGIAVITNGDMGVQSSQLARHLGSR